MTAHLEFWLLCTGSPFTWPRMVPKAVSSCSWETSCKRKSPRLGREALGSIPGSAPTLHMTLSMTLSMKPPLASVSSEGLDPTSWTAGGSMHNLPPPIGLGPSQISLPSSTQKVSQAQEESSRPRVPSIWQQHLLCPRFAF